ncbi:HNH endonuclease [Bradyrhizobium manausense]|uniref:HNH endonuclease n=1 Tax=Bradyrhizobium manausense TaxID=989370 RepID=UPI001BAB2570|nr:HNH endonuclease [Bradyrhizobium manausense]
MEWNEARLEEFWSHVVKGGPEQCWLWSGPILDGRYGRLWNIPAHRLSCEIVNGPIPPGMLVMHSCDNGFCVNPRHLSVGTPAENMADKMRKGRSGTTRLCASEVREIRALREQGYSFRKIAAETGVALSGVHGIANRRKYYWIP